PDRVEIILIHLGGQGELAIILVKSPRDARRAIEGAERAVGEYPLCLAGKADHAQALFAHGPSRMTQPDLIQRHRTASTSVPPGQMEAMPPAQQSANRCRVAWRWSSQLTPHLVARVCKCVQAVPHTG